jgi:disulfide bond formation protein DsbB
MNDDLTPLDSINAEHASRPTWRQPLGWPSQRWLGLVALAAVALLAFGLYLQHVVGLEPCPMCIVQRYALMGVGVLALLGWVWRRPRPQLVVWVMLGLVAGFGAFTAARQSWLQWYPPEVVSCGRDFYGMIESFPIGRAIPMIFRGSGDCTQIDWTFLGGSIANWSFLWFFAFILLAIHGVRLQVKKM